MFRAHCAIQFRFMKACKYSKSKFSKQRMISNYCVWDGGGGVGGGGGNLAQRGKPLLSMQEALGSMPRFSIAFSSSCYFFFFSLSLLVQMFLFFYSILLYSGFTVHLH